MIRILKEGLEGLTMFNYTSVDKILSWLEKQKEQKPVEKETTLTGFEEVLNTFLFDFANSPIEDCEPKEYIKKHSAEILKAAYKELNAKLQQDIFEAKQEGRREGYEAGKAEQKPAEWSEFDKGVLEDAICATDTLANDKSFNKSNPNLAKAFRIAKDWLQSLPERFNLQPKQEWSEEDEARRKEILSYFIVGALPSIDRRKACVDWLKSLRPQYHGDVTMTEAYKMGLEAGKASSWKPSKEQMDALKEALETYKGFEEYDAMKSLYNDLKKLM